MTDLIDKFFEKRLITTFNTRKSYKSNINKYFKIIGKDINTYFNETLESIENDLNKAYMQLDKQEVPLLSRRTFFNAIRQFLCTHDKKLKDLDFWDILKSKVRGADPISEELVPNTTDLKTVLSHGNTLSRAMYLMMASCGCRIGELLALTENDIDTDSKPTKLTISKTYDSSSKNYTKMLTKTRKKRIAFISDEATDAYMEWMKERSTWLKHAAHKAQRFNKNKDDPRIFPMTDNNAMVIWTNLVKKSKLYKENKERDITTGRLILHPHCLRKFFRSYLGNADLSEHLMGHATGMDRHYRNMKKEDLAELYFKHMQNVTVFETPADTTHIQNEMAQLQKDNQEMKAEWMEKRLEVQELKQKIAEMEKKLG